MIEKLIHLGFTQEEARIYIACLEVGTAPISAISRRTNTKRQTCLYTINKLIYSGYLSSIKKDGITYYIPENPDILRKKAIIQVERSESLVPELLSITNTLTKKPKIRFYEGKNINKVLDEIKQEEKICVITNLDMAIKNHKEILIRFREERKNNEKTKTRIITYDTIGIHEFLNTYGIPPGDEYRYINQGTYEIQNDIVILENKVVILSIPIEDAFAFVIEGNSFVQSQKAIFEMIWDIGLNKEI